MSDDLPQTAYGMALHGLPDLTELVSGEQLPDAPEVTIRCRPRADALALRPLDDRGVTRLLSDGRVLALSRRHGTATLYGDPMPAELLAHPFLAAVAPTFSRWSGRESFHAGAFVHADRAWAVLGHRTAGKSTLLAALADRGTEVLSDDIVITDGGEVFRGPRCIDLRSPLPGGSLSLQPARLDTRWRVRLPAGPPTARLGGWLFLHWSSPGAPQPVAHPVPARELIRRLAARRASGSLPSDPAVLLALASRPAWDVYRPRSWPLIEETVQLVTALLDATSGDASPTRSPVEVA